MEPLPLGPVAVIDTADLMMKATLESFDLKNDGDDGQDRSALLSSLLLMPVTPLERAA